VHLYEKNARPGGLLVYGIPDFKMEKQIIARRQAQMEAEGVVFHCNVRVGTDLAAQALLDSHDAVLLAMGSETPFDFFAKSPGRDLDGLHYAMDFLTQQNRRVAGEAQLPGTKEISAKGKHVIVIGGGDTGSDCIGTSFRQGAKSVTQLEIMPKPPVKENKDLTWPAWPLKLRISTSQAEGAAVEYSVSTTGFSGEGGRVKKLHYVHVDPKMQPIPGSDATLDAELVLFAMGFSGPADNGVLTGLGLEPVARGRFKGLDASERDYRLPGGDKLFAAGDVRRGQSLVVWAIREGRQAASAIDKFLMGKTTLPR
jgi:glutamate synthase (NADPH/NADH) small chain